ncbi:MAG: molecular chaperone DnaJ [Candidatus Hydrogenedentes bacterium]|nr:molecular chaperone DnaJ [Candidatus Hydrogenedentota bacterium]
MPATAQKSHYELLGVPRSASQDEIRRAYLKLAKKYHPDKTGGDKTAEEKLKEINAAYDVLKNPEKRRQYDALLDNPFAGAPPPGGGSPFGDFAGGGGFGFHNAFEDLFGGIFGRRRAAAPRGPVPGEDLEVVLDISLRDAAFGASKTIRIGRRVSCGACGGSGAAPGTRPETCPQCQGKGQVSHGGGAFFMSRTCPRCHGEGQVIASPCRACHGTGQTKESRTASVAIPAGAETGTRLRLAGQGNAGERGAPAGDLYVVTRVQDDPVFKQQGNDLVCEASLTFAQAALGATVRVPTLDGHADLKVPAGTQPGSMFRLRGLGMPSLTRGGKGDLLVHVQVRVPARLSREQRDLIERLGRLDG